MEPKFTGQRYFGHVPLVKRLVEGFCASKHKRHIKHIGHVPIVERLVEGLCIYKHTCHIRHVGHVPLADVAVFYHKMFDEATSFNQPLNNWNVSKVTTMAMMFVEATSFNQPLNNWNVSKVTNMEAMFWGATSFNQPLHAPWYAVEQSDSE